MTENKLHELLTSRRGQTPSRKAAYHSRMIEQSWCILKCKKKIGF